MKTSYYISYISCGISVVDTVVTIAEQQLLNSRHLSSEKYTACETGYGYGFQSSISLTSSIRTSTINLFFPFHHFNATIQDFKRKKIEFLNPFNFPFKPVELLQACWSRLWSCKMHLLWFTQDAIWKK